MGSKAVVAMLLLGCLLTLLSLLHNFSSRQRRRMVGRGPRGVWHRSLQLPHSSVGLMVRLLLLLLWRLRPWVVDHSLNRHALRLESSLMVSLWGHVVITASVCGRRWRQRGCGLDHVRGHGVVPAMPPSRRSTVNRWRNGHRVGIT